MKIGVRKVGPLGTLYNDKYGKEYFDRLWKEHLLDKLEADDEVVWFDRMPIEPDGFHEVLGDLDAVIGAWIFDNMITEEMLTKHPNLKYISTISHGFTAFDVEACRRHNVIVTNTIFNNYAVAQHTMALLLEIALSIGKNDRYYKEEKWTADKPNKLFTKQIELNGLNFGVVGLGHIGLMVSQMAMGFGMNVYAYDPFPKSGKEYEAIRQVDFDTLIETCDIISLHCPKMESTKDIINADTIARMKDGVILLNCARGDLIDEDALLDGLNTGKIYAAGLDVLKGEPLKEKTDLLAHPNVVATEHIAWATPESRVRSVTVACENFFNWRNGNPTSVVS